MAIQIPTPPPMRDAFIAPKEQKTNQGAGGASGISRPWFIWLKSVFDTILAQINAITGLTITSATQAQLAALGPTLQPNSLVSVTDFGHLLEWDGTVFGWGPGEQGSGFIAGFLFDPTAAGWHVCDGSLVNMLNADGSTTAVTLPDYTTAAYVKFGTAAAGGPTAASGASGATSGGTPTGTNGNNSASVAVLAGVGTTVAADPHTHTFAGDLLPTHTHSPGTLELRRSQLKAYFRQ